jgi:hypothetical protein
MTSDNNILKAAPRLFELTWHLHHQGTQDPRGMHKGLRTPQDEGDSFLRNAGIGSLGDVSHATKPELHFINELSHSDCK